MVKVFLFLFVFLTPLVLGAQETSQSTEQYLKELNNKIPQLLEDFSIPGAAVAIIDNGEIVLQKGYGFADVKRGVKVDMKTGFNIGSISKTVTAWGVMKLVHEGKIDLDTPVKKYLTKWQLPESEFDSDKVTVRRLLSHTAGLSLPSVSTEKSFDNLPSLVDWLNGKNDGLGRVEIILEPGTRWVYSGGGYGVLQLIIEEVSGQKFEDYMQVAILDPLGMTNSSFRIDDRVRSASATPYDRFGEEAPFGIYTVQAAAGLHTTLEDFVRFALASLPGHKEHKKYNSVLPVELVQKMMEPAPNSAIGGWKYGLGYQTVHMRSSQVFIGHSGSNTGWQASFRLDPTSNAGFIVLTNGSAGDKICDPMFCKLINRTSVESGGDNCWPQRSIANELFRIINEKGIEDVEKIYASIKEEHPYKYDYSEGELNGLGYYYMGRDELDKALAIFQLNVELFPNSYNVYDSYGEALLASGYRQEAKENYIQSVGLNSGNENGIRVLDELGVTPEDLVERLSVILDHQILNGYIGSYEASSGEELIIGKSKGQLTADLQGTRRHLIAESESRFSVLGEGSVVTFFTSATGIKGLWMNGGIFTKMRLATADGGDSTASSLHSANQQTSKFLVLRNKHSWNRPTDFENVLKELNYNFEQRESGTMADLDLSSYDVIIIPGSQNEDFYNNYVSNIKRFNKFVASGGTLVLELNGAEKNKSIVLPKGVVIEPSKAMENIIVKSGHPVFYPLLGKDLIRARYASMGYLKNIPDDALILAIEAEGTDVYADRPTFIEYNFGKGRVIAASQCFHDRDGSGRGPLMESVISYTAQRRWAIDD